MLKQPVWITPGFTRLLFVTFFAFGLVAWVEENLFRDYLQIQLADKMNIGLAIILQALIFSIAHLGYSRHILDFGSAFITGLFLGSLRGRESSLVLMAACSPDSLSDRFVALLGEIVTFVFDAEENLVLNLKMDAVNMIFASARSREHPNHSHPQQKGLHLLCLIIPNGSTLGASTSLAPAQSL